MQNIVNKDLSFGERQKQKSQIINQFLVDPGFKIGTLQYIINRIQVDGWPPWKVDMNRCMRANSLRINHLSNRYSSVYEVIYPRAPRHPEVHLNGRHPLNYWKCCINVHLARSDNVRFWEESLTNNPVRCMWRMWNLVERKPRIL